MPPILSSRPLVLKQSLHNILSCLLTSVAFSSQNTPYLVPYCLFLPLPYIMPLFSLPFVCSSEKHTIYFFLSVILLSHFLVQCHTLLHLLSYLLSLYFSFLHFCFLVYTLFLCTVPHTPVFTSLYMSISPNFHLSSLAY